MLNDKGDAERNLNFYLIYEIKTPNSEFTLTAKDSTQREKIPYICGLRTRIECEPGGEHSTRSDRVTNIGYLLSLGAVFLLEMELLFHVGVIWGIARRLWLFKKLNHKSSTLILLF